MSSKEKLMLGDDFSQTEGFKGPSERARCHDMIDPRDIDSAVSGFHAQQKRL